MPGLHAVGVGNDLIEREAWSWDQDVLALVGQHGHGQLQRARAAAGDHDVVGGDRCRGPRVRAGHRGARKLVAVGGRVPIELVAGQRVRDRCNAAVGRLEVAEQRRVAWTANQHANKPHGPWAQFRHVSDAVRRSKEEKRA